MSYAIGGEAEHYQPKDPLTPECSWCDGTKMVEVGSIIAADDLIHSLYAYGKDYFVEVECPRCREHPGVEPVPEREER
jgi:hypothetical protein